MPSLPSSLALTNIADGASIIASDHRNNYAAIQTGFNGLLTAMTVTAKGDLLVATASGAIANVAAGLNSQVLNVDSTQGSGVKWVYPPGYALNYTQITASVSIVSTTEATGTTIISPGAITFDGTPVWVEFFTPDFKLPAVASAFGVVSLFEGATQIGELCLVENAATNAGAVPAIGKFRFTPTAAAHTYTVTAFVTSTTGTPQIVAGAGGTGTPVPAYVLFTKA